MPIFSSVVSRAPRHRFRPVMEAMETRQLLTTVSGLNQATPNQLFVDRLFVDVLARPADDSALIALGPMLDSGRLSRLQLVQVILSSPGAYQQDVNRDYLSLLNRPADPAGLSWFSSALSSGASLDAVEASLIGSPEFVSDSGGSNSSFLTLLFVKVLGRPIDAPTATALLSAMTSGVTPGQVATWVLTTPEARRVEVQGEFQRLLRRSPDEPTLESFTNSLVAGETEYNLDAILMASPEYFNAGWEPEIPPGDPAAVSTAESEPARVELDGALRQEAQQGHVNVLFFGDSITAAWTLPDLGAPVWQRDFVPLNSAAFGIPGDATQNMLWRIQSGELNGLKPKVIVLNAGTNDIAFFSAQQTAGGVRANVLVLQNQFPQAKILVVGILPFDVPTAPAGLENRIRVANALIAKMDTGNPSLRYVDVGSDFLESDGSIIPGLFADGVHPTVAGFALYSALIKPTINAMLG
jgi:lysophospholipase L1-like esterase